MQPLISKDTGDVLFIDFTEAIELTPPLSFMETSLISSFCTEMAALIPDSMLPVASKDLLDEIMVLSDKGVTLSKESYEAICSQPFASDEIVRNVDALPLQHDERRDTDASIAKDT